MAGMRGVKATMSTQRILRFAAPFAAILALAACGDGGEPSQQDIQAALGASKELPADPSIQVEKMRCQIAPSDKQAFLCEYRFPPEDPLKGTFKKDGASWRHVDAAVKP